MKTKTTRMKTKTTGPVAIRLIEDEVEACSGAERRADEMLCEIACALRSLLSRSRCSCAQF
jgi:hypothetical protein